MTIMVHSIPTLAIQLKLDRALWAVDTLKPVLLALRRELSAQFLLVQEQMTWVNPPGIEKALMGTLLHIALEAMSPSSPHIRKGLPWTEVLTRRPHRLQGILNAFSMHLLNTVILSFPVL